MKATLFVWMQFLLPQRLLGRCIYHLARCERSFLKTPLIKWFAKHYSVDLDEAERRKLERAAGLCPIMGSLDPSTDVEALFEYGVAAAA